MSRVSVYTMTSHKSPKSLNGRAVYTLEAETGKGPANVTRFVQIEATANGAAVEVIAEALEHVKAGHAVDIYTESPYAANGLSEWMEQWKKEGWKNSKGKDIANRAAWEHIAEMLAGREYSVHLQEKHSFRRWMEAQLKRKGETKHV
jgi:ribonuclease HI